MEQTDDDSSDGEHVTSRQETSISRPDGDSPHDDAHVSNADDNLQNDSAVSDATSRPNAASGSDNTSRPDAGSRPDDSVGVRETTSSGTTVSNQERDIDEDDEDDENEENGDEAAEQGNVISSSLVMDEIRNCQHQINLASIALEQLRKVIRRYIFYRRPILSTNWFFNGVHQSFIARRPFLLSVD